MNDLVLITHGLAGGILHEGWDGKTNRTGGLEMHAPAWGGLRLKQSAAGVILVRICTSHPILNGVTYACTVSTRYSDRLLVQYLHGVSVPTYGRRTAAVGGGRGGR